MAVRTKSDQILCGVASELATRHEVMYLKIFQVTARLAMPAVSP